MSIEQNRDSFSGSFGTILAAVGSAIGLGNFWKFPYITGTYGGSAFIIVYLGCIAVLGIPLLLSEFIIGRNSHHSVISAFSDIAPKTKWRYTGWLSLSSTFIILTFYSIISGWTLYYAYTAITVGFTGLTPNEVSSKFTAFITNPWQPIIWQVMFVIATAYIVIKGIKDGIEKYSKILMPILFLMIIILDIRTVTLEGSQAGLDFLFNPDFSKLTLEAILSALAHCFFTLSIGMSIMITYGTYIKPSCNLGSIVVKIALADTLIALLAGIAIFPAVFAFGITPSQGPTLVFITLPNIFNQMPLGNIFAALFFILLSVAALTSAISILEPSVTYLVNELKWNRKKATISMITLTTIGGAILTQGNGILSDLKLPFYIGGKFKYINIFDWAINLSDIMLPLAGFFIAIFVGWIVNKKLINNELTSHGKFRASYEKLFLIAIKFIAPFLIAFIFLSTIFGFFK